MRPVREGPGALRFILRNRRRRTLLPLFNEELADRLGIASTNTPIAPIVVADADGVRHRSIFDRCWCHRTRHVRASSSRGPGRPNAASAR